MSEQGKFTLALDLSTSASKTCLVDPKGQILTESKIPHKTYIPHSDWIEQDPNEIISNVRASITETLRLFKEQHNGDAKAICSIGITNQRETLVVWSRSTRKALYQAIVWYDGRTADITERYIKQYGDINAFKKVNGLIISTYFTVFKLLWVLENVPEVRNAYDNDDLLVGTIDSWIVYNLSTEHNHYTDATNASRTFLMNLKTLQWDSELLKVFGIKETVLPRIKNCIDDYGTVSINGLEHANIKCVMGDQQSAAYTMGLCNSQTPVLKITYGTGVFMILNTNEQILDIEGLLSTVIYKDDKKVIYGVEGSIEAGGTTQLFFRENLLANESQILKDIEAVHKFDCPEIFVPSFGKVLAPFWRSTKGCVIADITYSTMLTNFYRAGLEGMAFRVKQCYDRLPDKINRIYIDGGLSNCSYLMRFQAMILESDLMVMDHKDCTMYGVALCAGGFPELVHGEKDYDVISNQDTQSDRSAIDVKYKRFCELMADTLL